MLENSISYHEIKRAIFNSGNEKAPGPDEFTFKPLKSQWEHIKEDVMSFVKYFELTGRISKGCNSSFITLVPKIKDIINLGDCSLISLIGCMYKIIAKAHATRLKKVIRTMVDKVHDICGGSEYT